MGLPTALQFVVFGLVIIGGMLVSGDRIIRAVEQVLRERKRPDVVESRDRRRSATGRDEKGGTYQRVRAINGWRAPSTEREGEHETDQDHRASRRRLLAMVAAACSSGDDERRDHHRQPPAATGATAATGGTGPLAQYGESTNADPALVEKAMGSVEPSDEPAGHHPGLDRPGQPGSRPGDDRQGDGVLERDGVRHRHRWRHHHGVRRRRRAERLASGDAHGGHPPGAHVPGDRQDDVPRRPVEPGSGGRRRRHPVPDPGRRRLHHRLPGPGHEHRRRHPGGQGGRDPVLHVFGGLGGSPRPGRGARPRSGLPHRRR